jgi:hypothetical protein
MRTRTRDPAQDERAPLLHRPRRLMRNRFVTAAVVALSLLGQPLASVWCAVRCHGQDIARMASEHHCGSDARRDPSSPALTGDVAFCNHDVMIASKIIERHQIVRRAQTEAAVAIKRPQSLAAALVRGISHRQEPPGSVAVPLPLRI